MYFLASSVQEVFERILKRHSHIAKQVDIVDSMKHSQENNHIYPGTSRKQIVGWTFNPEVTGLWEAISKQKLVFQADSNIEVYLLLSGTICSPLF